VRYPRFTKRLQPQDLGLEDNDVNERLISLGHKKLLPKDALAGLGLIESRTHALVERSSFSFLGGIARFLPNAKLGEVQQGLDELEKDFAKARAKFLDDYAVHRSAAMVEWERTAKNLPGNPAQLLGTIRGAFPDAVELTAKFGFDIHLFQVRVPERVSAQIVRFTDQQKIIEARNKAASDATQRIHEGVENFVRDAVATLREQTANLCSEMLSSMDDGKLGVHQKTLNRLVKFIDDFKQLNFAGDGEMDALLEKARTELLSESAEDYRDDATARLRLQQGIRQLGDSALNLAKQDSAEIVSSFGQLGVRKFQLAA
jgi:hypothetical protein